MKAPRKTGLNPKSKLDDDIKLTSKAKLDDDIKLSPKAKLDDELILVPKESLKQKFNKYSSVKPRKSSLRKKILDKDIMIGKKEGDEKK